MKIKILEKSIIGKKMDVLAFILHPEKTGIFTINKVLFKVKGNENIEHFKKFDMKDTIFDVEFGISPLAIYKINSIQEPDEWFLGERNECDIEECESCQ